MLGSFGQRGTPKYRQLAPKYRFHDRQQRPFDRLTAEDIRQADETYERGMGDLADQCREFVKLG
jgi:hypothetical protein